MKKDCKRYDKATLAKPVKLDNGYLKADAALTRTGVFVYRNPDGTERRELRLAEEVFKKESLDSFAMMPVTDEHPPEFLTAENTSKYQRGHMGDEIRSEGKLVAGAMMVTDAHLVGKVVSGEQQQVSCGYTCDLEEKSGEYEGEKYDGIQRNIRGNHVAIVKAARAGPEARVRMDSSSAVMVSIAHEPGTEPAPTREGTRVKKIKIDGVEYEAGSEQAEKAHEVYVAKLETKAKELDARGAKLDEADKTVDEKVKAAKAEADKSKAKADELEAQKLKLDEQLKSAPAIAKAEMKARLELESKARGVLGKKFQLDGLTDNEVRLAVLKKLDEKFSPKGKSEEYIAARFDAALEFDAEDTGGEGGERADEEFVTDDEDDVPEPGAPGEEMSLEDANKSHTDSASAYEGMLIRNRNAWKEPVRPHASDAK